MDLVGPFPIARDGSRYALTLIDLFTRWLELVPISSAKALVIADAIVKNLVCTFTSPARLLSDRGRNLLDPVVKAVCTLMGTKRVVMIAENPKCNGRLESTHKHLKDQLSKYISDKQTDWPRYLPFFKLKNNTIHHSSINITPDRLLFVRDPPKLTHILPSLETDQAILPDDYRNVDLLARLQKEDGARQDLIEETAA
uniref:Integrase catalytic domain-containing protein n=1 Tax=Chromera velia CCMP2878 TaxID=1169474 RepID=A0A0G4G687_9ALVE|eukprot:Cvel_20438.t1-p1 / transcript=Cvel_20438.t1 / gene=Cvel_20438 / organism=Chromera_velia_CCMP2878 / gene_product=Retrovirus-related Pol polyprotein from transposon, putative / transcript_product=Retrovirus-related Pol polyprotein from transposon, putative / location=Cvel_scaffold1832:7204-7794(+) / protein_length=197 / sequence_SO=supercontig / SO=protein_coding / is_pseudo=false